MQLSSEIQSVSLLNVKLQTELGEWKNKVLELETANRQLQGNVERLTEMLNTDNNSGRGGDGEMKLLHAVRSPVINANTSTSGRGEEELVNVIMRLTE